MTTVLYKSTYLLTYLHTYILTYLLIITAITTETFGADLDKLKVNLKDVCQLQHNTTLLI